MISEKISPHFRSTPLWLYWMYCVLFGDSRRIKEIRQRKRFYLGLVPPCEILVEYIYLKLVLELSQNWESKSISSRHRIVLKILTRTVVRIVEDNCLLDNFLGYLG